MGASLGALEIGILLSSALFGVLTAQVYTYHKNFHNERLWIKLVELGHTICIFHMIYFYTITHFGDLSTLNVVPSSLGAAVVLHGIIIVFVQGYFTYRIWRFSERLYIPIFSTILIICQALAIVMLGVELITTATKGIIQFVDKWGWLTFILLVLRSISNIIISGAMVYYLGISKKNAYKKTVVVLDKLILWSIETGMVISIMEFFSLILASVSHQDRTLSKIYIWIGLLVTFPKVFSITMMANINSRMDLRKTLASPGRTIPVHANTLNIAMHTEVNLDNDVEVGNETMDRFNK
ncbi:hypothetical protein GYMLUDRAFT_76539 [Collybiopsis luxurians FD-317 M1]|uniref:DUF6534 domain-containing protein n=1 Tax=Collybiopsis luxurians FD-317 M1 TaxID=944289 RepID=A0A0D0AXX5_9AGAR|nr:hypothetical protein GYMLUDRAFT_76539 [Collybiopsis luxurians FD-317 M1]